MGGQRADCFQLKTIPCQSGVVYFTLWKTKRLRDQRLSTEWKSFTARWGAWTSPESGFWGMKSGWRGRCKCFQRRKPWAVSRWSWEGCLWAQMHGWPYRVIPGSRAYGRLEVLTWVQGQPRHCSVSCVCYIQHVPGQDCGSQWGLHWAQQAREPDRVVIYPSNMKIINVQMQKIICELSSTRTRTLKNSQRQCLGTLWQQVIEIQILLV